MRGDTKVLILTCPGGELKKSEEDLTRKSKTDIKAKIMVKNDPENGGAAMSMRWSHLERRGVHLREHSRPEPHRSFVTGYYGTTDCS